MENFRFLLNDKINQLIVVRDEIVEQIKEQENVLKQMFNELYKQN